MQQKSPCAEYINVPHSALENNRPNYYVASVNNRQDNARIRWRWGIYAATLMMFIAFFPQAHFMLHRGHKWRGANAVMHWDEVAYSAYLASLIRGNPRRY